VVQRTLRSANNFGCVIYTPPPLPPATPSAATIHLQAFHWTRKLWLKRCLLHSNDKVVYAYCTFKEAAGREMWNYFILVASQEKYFTLASRWKKIITLYKLVTYLYLNVNRLGGVVVSMLATGPKGLGFKPGRGAGFLKAINIRSTPSFGWEVKPEASCRKILRHVKEPCLALLRCYVKNSRTSSFFKKSLAFPKLCHEIARHSNKNRQWCRNSFKKSQGNSRPATPVASS
jgi:hypothetical protein